ncbi:hypothetical protein [Methanoregula sp.]|uniref:hypothetical protein n=1 Tax=Methanoregula sp. TaxID=2052170 RepID=UPI000CB2ADBB|nr:hypothetical protein [Methanoregula sp.]PKG33784.1 MAG: hypothetical protein CW742_01185 [Methanoregula sp.]
MTAPGPITTVKAGSEFRICPSCGYELGFHTSFLGTNADKDNPVKSTREVFRVILICPECGARYDVGWRVSFSELESKFVIAPVRPVQAPASSPQVTIITSPPALPSHDLKDPD